MRREWYQSWLCQTGATNTALTCFSWSFSKQRVIKVNGGCYDSPKAGTRHPQPELLGPGASCSIQGAVHSSIMQIGQWRTDRTWTLPREVALSSNQLLESLMCCWLPVTALTFSLPGRCSAWIAISLSMHHPQIFTANSESSWELFSTTHCVQKSNYCCHIVDHFIPPVR